MFLTVEEQACDGNKHKTKNHKRNNYELPRKVIVDHHGLHRLTIDESVSHIFISNDDLRFICAERLLINPRWLAQRLPLLSEFSLLNLFEVLTRSNSQLNVLCELV